MLSALADRTTARPKRTLLLVVLFVVDRRHRRRSGRRVARDRRRLHGHGVGLGPRRRADRGGHRRAGGAGRGRAPAHAGSGRGRGGRPSRARAATGDRVGQRDADGQPRRALGLSRGDALARRRRGRRRQRARGSASRVQPDVLLGGSVFAQSQIGDSVSADLGRAEALAFPVLLLLSLLFFRGRATVLPLAVGITTVLGTFLALTAVNQAYSLSIFALNLVIGLGLGLGDRLHALPRHAVPRGARAPGRRRRRGAHDDEHRRPDRRVQRGDRRLRADHADRVPARLPEVDGHRGRRRRPARRAGLAGDRAGVVRALGQQARGPAPRPRAPGRAGRVVSPRPRRDAAPAARRARDRRADARARAAGAARGLEPGRLDGDPEGPERADRRRHGRRATSAGRTRARSPWCSRLPRARQAGVQRYAASLEQRPGVRAVSEPRSLDASTWQVDVLATGDPEGEVARDVVQRRARGRGALSVARRRRRRGVHRPAGAIALEPPARGRAADRADDDRPVADDRLDRAADQGDRDERADGRIGARRS